MKRIIVFFLVVCMIVVITGCGDTPNNNAETAPAAPSEATASGSSVTGSTPQSNTVSGPERPALLISDGKIIEEKSDGNFYYYSFKVKITTDQTITWIYLAVTYLDKDGTIVDTSNCSESTRIAPNQSIVLEGLGKKAEISGLSAIVDHYEYRYGKDDTYVQEYVDDSPIIVFP